MAFTLSEVINRVIDAELQGKLPDDRDEILNWLVGQIDQPNSYSRMPSPTDAEMENWPSLYSGEPIVSRVSVRHILGEEASRAIIRLRRSPTDLQNEVNACGSLFERLPKDLGWYCCRPCTVSYWRHLSARQDEARLSSAMKELTGRQTENGRWGAMPFYYVVLSLISIDNEGAKQNLQHAAKALERAANRNPDGVTAARRKAIAEAALSRI